MLLPLLLLLLRAHGCSLRIALKVTLLQSAAQFVCMSTRGNVCVV